MDRDTTSNQPPSDHTPRPPRRSPEAVSGGPTRDAFDGVLRDDQRYLLGLASRMLGDTAAAEDVVQDALSRLVGVRVDEIHDVRGWLAVVVRRLCLNHLGSAYNRREAVAGAAPPEHHLAPGAHGNHGNADPADRVTLDDQVRFALAIMLDRLTPAERTAFVLHDVFGFPFDGVAEIVGRTPVACRQLASRARRSIRTEAGALQPDPALTDQHSILVERFIAACAGGSIAELTAVLDPGIVGKATLQGHGFLGQLEGSHVVATRLLEQFGPGTDTTLVPVPLEGQPGIVAITDGHMAAVLRLDVAEGVVRHIRSFIHRPA
jgi:RNA polymerase sigma-70 factor (ECF subfamily)